MPRCEEAPLLIDFYNGTAVIGDMDEAVEIALQQARGFMRERS